MLNANDRHNLNKIREFLVSEQIEFSQNLEKFEFDFKTIYEPVFTLKSHNGKIIELRYINSFDHRLDHCNSLGESFKGIHKSFFCDMSIKKQNEGVRVIYIKDYEIANERKWNVLKSYICTGVGKIHRRIYARDCEVKILTNKESRSFQEQNCFFGYRNATVILGLVLKKDIDDLKKGTLVFLESFGMNFYGNKLHKESPNIEVIRVGTLLYSQVIGGSSKLLNYFLNNYKILNNHEVKKLIFYVDFCHNDGSSLKSVGYDFERIDKSGFHNVALENIPELGIAANTEFGRRPSKNALIKKLLKENIIYDVPTAGTLVYSLTL